MHIRRSAVVQNRRILKVSCFRDHESRRIICTTVPIPVQLHLRQRINILQINGDVGRLLDIVIAIDRIVLQANRSIYRNRQRPSRIKIRCRFLGIRPRRFHRFIQRKVTDRRIRYQFEICLVQILQRLLLCGRIITIRNSLCLLQQTFHIGICPGIRCYLLLERFQLRNPLRQCRLRNLTIAKAAIIDTDIRYASLGKIRANLGCRNCLLHIFGVIGAGIDLTIHIQLQQAVIFTYTGNDHAFHSRL